MNWSYGNGDQAAKEQEAVDLVAQFARDNADVLRRIWHWGDGFGGGVADLMARSAGIERTKASVPAYIKAVIPASLRTSVFERDAYRCIACGGHLDLTCDHIVPESKGGPTTIENLQTMCRSCNSKKGARA